MDSKPVGASREINPRGDGDVLHQTTSTATALQLSSSVAYSSTWQGRATSHMIAFTAHCALWSMIPPSIIIPASRPPLPPQDRTGVAFPLGKLSRLILQVVLDHGCSRVCALHCQAPAYMVVRRLDW